MRIVALCCAGPGRCLEAFVVALNMSCDGNVWYTSTKELQLASLQFCVACRNVPTLHLAVKNTDVPARLWNDHAATEAYTGAKRLSTTRVPAFRPREVTWGQPAWFLSDICLVFAKVERFLVRQDTVLDDVVWPCSLKKLSFGESFDTPLRGRLHLRKSRSGKGSSGQSMVCCGQRR